MMDSETNRGDPLVEKKEEIVKEAKVLEDICQEASVRHDRMREFWKVLHISSGILLSLLFPIMAVTLLGGGRIVPLILSILGTVLVGSYILINPFKKAGENDAAGREYLVLKSKVKVFRTIACETEEVNVLYPKLESLLGEKEVVFHNAPPTFSFVLKKKGSGDVEAKVK